MTVHNIGIIGNESIRDNTGKILKSYQHWADMLKRCYTTKAPCYQGCTVSHNFRSYQYFKNWCEMQFGFGLKDWQLDKDLLFKGNKVYSEDTCCFLPRELNGVIAMRQTSLTDLPKGVERLPNGKYRARGVKLKDGQKIASQLGIFLTKEDAHTVYKTSKELLVKQLADKWQDHLDPKVYTKLLSWKLDDN